MAMKELVNISASADLIFWFLGLSPIEFFFFPLIKSYI